MYRAKEARYRAHQVLDMVGAMEPPVDIDKVAAALGFTVMPYEFPDWNSAVTFIQGDIKAIGVNKDHARTRQRFSAAHELGHYLNGHEAYDHGKTHVEDRQASWDPQEREADEFAAELLMPADWLKRDLAERGLNVPELARRYEVSEQAMWIQLIDLGLASQYAKR